MEVDVAIVGAGPGGSTLATLLAMRGVSVALIDRDTFPRDKLCGEFLSYDALPIVEALGIDLGEAPHIDRCRVVSRNRTYEFAFPFAARGVSRMKLDELLHRRAVAAGAVPITQAITSLAEIDARVIAGAWGRWGRFDQQLDRSFVHDRSHRNFGFKRHYRGAHESGVIELYSFARGYLGVSDVEDGITNICGLVHADRLAGHKGKWDTFIETIRAEEPRLDDLYGRFEPAQEHFLSSEPVIFRSRSAVEGGIFMIGDASGVIDPLTGNGMAMAIQSAVVAAPYILCALTDRRSAEDQYREEHRRMFGKRIGWSRRVAALLSRPALLDQSLRVAQTPAFGRFLLRHTRARRDEMARLLDRIGARPSRPQRAGVPPDR
ncbi:MAG TPA: NAD(P)/FAD-dependent oxidoreductase [Thermoanaerobaculia bacterium]|nr:NAD(P)/FAD-dependent oxidoreductase [Thermoanaerobaculia bacterium]